MQKTSSRIWTQVVQSISYDINHYTMGAYSGNLTQGYNNAVYIKNQSRYSTGLPG